MKIAKTGSDSPFRFPVQINAVKIAISNKTTKKKIKQHFVFCVHFYCFIDNHFFTNNASIAGTPSTSVDDCLTPPPHAVNESSNTVVRDGIPFLDQQLLKILQCRVVIDALGHSTPKFGPTCAPPDSNRGCMAAIPCDQL